MHPQILVVADPPHRTVDVDAVAEILGVAVDDATLKVGFPAPEVLLASGPYRADEVAHGLRGAGLNVGVIDAEALVGIPWPAPAASFAFEADGLVAQFQSQIVRIPYDAPLLGVYCKPPLDFSAPLTGVDAPPAGSRGGLGIAEAIQWMANLDLYFSNDAGLQRISIVQEVADFSGLGGRAGATAAESLAITVEECANRFTNIDMDARLEGVRPRHRFIMGDSSFDLDLRKLFSYGTLLLRQVLTSVSPELGELPQYELGSRLARVLADQRGKQ